MSKHLFRIFTIKSSLIILMLSLGIFFAWQMVRAAQCGSFIPSQKRGTCLSGVEGSTYWNGSEKRWEWTCDTLLCNAPGGCGNNVVDPGMLEECDGSDLDSKQCQDIPGYTGGTLSCSSCKFNVSACIEDITCGNGKIDQGEDCEINPLNLNGQTCASLKKGTGTLGCNAETCTFDVKQCQFCGNGKAENAEQCDGGDLKGASCQSLGLGDGTLACANCQYLTDDCSDSEGVCFNGILEKGEECEWPNIFRDNATCQTLGCGTGFLKCNAFICKFDKSSCEDPTCTKEVSSLPCVNPIWSDWQTIKESPLMQFVKPCPNCGPANGRSFDVLPTDVYDLCKNTKQLSVTIHDWSENGSKIGWRWFCGDNMCQAWAKPKCRADLADTDTCTATGAGSYATKADYEKKRDSKTGLCDIGFVSTADAYISNRYCVKELGNDQYGLYNSSWHCTTNKPGNTDNILCSTSWGGNGVCGSENGKTYLMRDSVRCSDNAYWQVEDKTEQPYLCGISSYLVPGSMYYDEIMVNGVRHSVLKWQCQWKQGTRLGGKATCSTSLNGVCQISYYSFDGKCGNALKMEWPRSTWPYKPGDRYYDLCVINDDFLNTTVVSYNETTKTWSWTCYGYTGLGGGEGKNAQCSVQASALCGTANNGSYLTEAAVRQAGPCAKGTLKYNRIYGEGSSWYWYCTGKDEASSVRCLASKCGSASNGSFTQPTFDGRKSTAGFLCGPNGQGTEPGNPVYNMTLRKSQWTWDCDYGEKGYIKGCQATEMACGSANTHVYLDRDFNVKNSFYNRQAYWATFLCTGGQTASLVRPSKDNNWRWTWNCQGTTGETLASSCYAETYHCGNYDGLVLAKPTFYSYWNNPALASGFCSHDSVKQSLGSVMTDEKGYWECHKNLDGVDYKTATCKYTPLTCGSATNKGMFTKSTLTSNTGQDNGFLCSVGGKTNEVTCNNNSCYWYCHDSYGGSTSICSAVELTCGRINNTSSLHPNSITMAQVEIWNYNNRLCQNEVMITPSRKLVEQNRLAAKTAVWKWQCQDSKGGLSAECSATCVGSGDYCQPL